MTTAAIKTKSIATDQIRIDGGTQARCEIDYDVVDDYAEQIENDADFPPVVVFFDGASYWLADGFHRFLARRKLDHEHIECDVRKGGVRDAKLFAVGANTAHGLKRTNADKRRAVEMLLEDSEWVKKSDRWIAEQCGVSNNFVGDVRRQLSSDDSSTREGRDGKLRELPRQSAMSELWAADQERRQIYSANNSDDFEPVDLNAALPNRKPIKREARDIGELAANAGSIAAQIKFLIEDIPATKRYQPAIDHLMDALRSVTSAKDAIGK